MDSRFRGNDTPWGPRVIPAQAGIQILRLSPPWERPAVPKAPPGEILCWESRGFLGKMEFRVVHGEAPWDVGGMIALAGSPTGPGGSTERPCPKRL